METDLSNPRGLPTGSVTLLFTDIERSTSFLERVGTSSYAQALAGLRRIIRTAIAEHSGVEVDTQGDAVFLAFRRAENAVALAREVQAALADGDINLRMGIHLGTPLVSDEGYVGRDVHRASRICGVAKGGQVLLSETTRAALGDRVSVRELGDFELRGLKQRERLYELQL